MTKPIDDVIADLRELEEKATPGEWSWLEYDCGDFDITASGNGPCDGRVATSGSRPDEQDAEISYANAALIAATRNALPRLLAYIAALEAVVLELSENHDMECDCHACTIMREFGILDALDNLKAKEAQHG